MKLNNKCSKCGADSALAAAAQAILNQLDGWMSKTGALLSEESLLLFGNLRAALAALEPDLIKPLPLPLLGVEPVVVNTDCPGEVWIMWDKGENGFTGPLCPTEAEAIAAWNEFVTALGGGR